MKRAVASQIIPLAVLTLTIILLGAAMAQYWPLGADYLYSYNPIAEKWIHGQTRLYDESALEFFLAPWAMVFLAPLTYLPLKVGQTVINMISLMSGLLAADLFRRKRPVSTVFVILAIANMHMLDVLIRGQVDGVLLLGLILAWWGIQSHKLLVISFAFCVLAMKPPNVILVGLLYLLAIRNWPRRDLLVVFSLPAVAVITSPLIAGIDWPVRYLTYIREHPVADHRSITIWKICAEFGIPIWPFVIIAVIAVATFAVQAWRQGLTLWTLSLAVTTNLMFAYYANGYHYLLLIPAFVLVAHYNRPLAILAYLATFTPAVRTIDATIMHWDYLYPLILYIGVWVYARREQPLPRERKKLAPTLA